MSKATPDIIQRVEELRSAMESDLESISDMEALMRTWEGLDQLEGKLGF